MMRWQTVSPSDGDGVASAGFEGLARIPGIVSPQGRGRQIAVQLPPERDHGDVVEWNAVEQTRWRDHGRDAQAIHEFREGRTGAGFRFWRPVSMPPPTSWRRWRSDLMSGPLGKRGTQDERPSDGSSRPLEEITPARLGIGALLSRLHDAYSWQNLPAPRVRPSPIQRSSISSTTHVARRRIQQRQSRLGGTDEGRSPKSSERPGTQTYPPRPGDAPDSRYPGTSGGPDHSPDLWS